MSAHRNCPPPLARLSWVAVYTVAATSRMAVGEFQFGWTAARRTGPTVRRAAAWFLLRWRSGLLSRPDLAMCLAVLAASHLVMPIADPVLGLRRRLRPRRTTAAAAARGRRPPSRPPPPPRSPASAWRPSRGRRQCGGSCGRRVPGRPCCCCHRTGLTAPRRPVLRVGRRHRRGPQARPTQRTCPWTSPGSSPSCSRTRPPAAADPVGRACA